MIAKSYTCPKCGAAVPMEGGVPPHFPFCTERCKMSDLYGWFNEEYSVPVEGRRVRENFERERREEQGDDET